MQNKDHGEINIKRILAGLFCAVLLLSIMLISRKTAVKTDHSNPSADASAVPSEESISTTLPDSTSSPIVSPIYAKQSYAPIEIDNSSNFNSGWALITGNANATASFAYDDIQTDVINSGSSITDIQLYREGIPFIKGNTYTLTFYGSSSISRTITVSIKNNDTSIKSQTCTLSSDSNSYSVEFEMTADTTWNGHVEFDFGNDGNSDAASEHTIELSGIRITPSSWNYGVKANQIGYLSNDEKRCTFAYDAGDVFDVINADTGEVVYSGAIKGKSVDDDTGETDCWGDFTNVTTPGTYLIRSQIGVSSYTFAIGNQVYDQLSSSLLKMLSLQRCGQNLDASWAGSLSHDECHTSSATIYRTTDTRDVTGGWHDAGDYGRYIKTGSKAVNDLLFAYLYNTSSISDQNNSVQSGNGTSDLLDEARYELEWMLKMQDSDGGVFNKVLTANIAETILPEQDNQPLYILETETTATADFGGTMAVAAIAYKSVDPDFADKCLSASIKAETYLNSNTTLYDKRNPSDINGGEYLDNTDSDGRFYTEIALWVATGDSSYLESAKNIYQSDTTAVQGISWSNNGGYGRYLYLMQPDAQAADSKFYDEMLSSLTSDADLILGLINSSGYNASIDTYVWGSNGSVSDNGVLLTMAYDATGKQEYRQAAIEQVSYIFGRNSLDMSFVSGFGSKYPKNVHSRIAQVKGVILPGALVGGPDASREDPVTQSLAADTANAKVYSDSFESYSTNEISIYWNASLIHLLTKIR